MKEEILKKLLSVQIALKAPKNKRNRFGDYDYRSCESILQSAKPHLEEAGLTISISDEIVMIGERIYVRAVVYVNGEEMGSAFAREQETKKGMDEAQITGSASSYARKYALNGVFLIDDSVDIDSLDNSQKETPATPKATTAKKSPSPPPATVNRNEGVTEWEKWKTPKGVQLGEFVDDKSKTSEEKEKDLNLLKKWLEDKVKSTKDENEAHGFQRDMAFVFEALTKVVPF